LNGYTHADYGFESLKIGIGHHEKMGEERDKHNSDQTYTFVMLSVDRKIACKK